MWHSREFVFGVLVNNNVNNLIIFNQANWSEKETFKSVIMYHGIAPDLLDIFLWIEKLKLGIKWSICSRDCK